MARLSLMKKNFRTVIDESARAFDSIIFSAGKIGYQVQVNPEDLKKIIRYEFADITISNNV